MTLYEFAKYAFFTLIFLTIIPGLITNLTKQYSQLLEHKTSVGIIELNGVLTDSGPLSAQLTKFFKDSHVKAIVLKVDCAGSSAGTGYALHNEIMRLKNTFHKPIITLVENVCASGAYWIACATDHIIAPSTALIGSIGVTFQYLFEFPKVLEQYNIGYHSITAGKYKATGDPFKTMTADEQSLLQSVIDDTYEQFAHSVAQARQLSLDTIDTWANGKIFTGNQAKELKLIDQVGSLQDLIDLLKEKILVVGDINWVKPQVSHGLLHFVFDTSDKDEVSMSSVINSICRCMINRCASFL